MPTFKVLAEEYLAASNKRSLKDDRSKLANILIPVWKTRKIDSFQKKDITSLLKSRTSAGNAPSTVNRLVLPQINSLRAYFLCF